MKYIRYRVAGLGVLSDTSLPELEPQSVEPCGDDDFLTVRLADAASAKVPPSLVWYLDQRLDNGDRWMARAKNDEGYLLRYHELADFWVGRAGRQIACCARTAGVSDLTIRALLLDHVLPLVMALRGKYVLHAAAMVADRGSCAFVGDSGSGKSTLAMSFSRAGHRILTDDCLVLEDRGTVLALATHPSVKLCGDALEALMPRATATEPVADYTSKRRLRLRPSELEFSYEPHPLARIYFLSRMNAEAGVASPEIEPLSPRDTFFELVNYCIRMDSTKAELLLNEFRFAERVAGSMPARRLLMPNNLGALKEAHELVLADLEHT